MITALLGAVTAAAAVGLAVGGTPAASTRNRIEKRRRARFNRRKAARPDTRIDQRLVTAALATVTAVTAFVIGPFLLLIVGALVVAGVLRRADRRERIRNRRIADTAPELIDLFGIAAAAGRPVPTALVTIAPRAPEPIRADLLTAARRLGHGASVTTALEGLRALGSAHQPLVDVLITAHRDGTPVLGALDRIADSARDRRRRDAEARVRRLPVTMLFPLVLCVLPAFGLLAVVPILVVSFTDLL